MSARPVSSPQKMYENEHAEYLFDEVLSPTAWRGPLEQGRLDACHHLARLVEQLEAATKTEPFQYRRVFESSEEMTEWVGDVAAMPRMKEQLETLRWHAQYVTDMHPDGETEVDHKSMRRLRNTLGSNPASSREAFHDTRQEDFERHYLTDADEQSPASEQEGGQKRVTRNVYDLLVRAKRERNDLRAELEFTERRLRAMCSAYEAQGEQLEAARQSGGWAAAERAARQADENDRKWRIGAQATREFYEREIAKLKEQLAEQPVTRGGEEGLPSTATGLPTSNQDRDPASRSSDE